MIELQKKIQQIESLNEQAMVSAKQHLNQLTKPPGSLGKLEMLAIQLAGISGELATNLDGKAVIVMAADHGVCQEGVSQYPQAVTVQMIANFLNGSAAVNVLARQAKADVFCVDIGSKAQEIHDPRLLSPKVRNGTGNICVEPAMTSEEVERAILYGIHLVKKLSDQGYTCFATGEMGIGNTTVSSALLTVMLEQSAEKLVGFGTGIDDRKRKHKQSVVERAVKRYQLAKKHERTDTLLYSIEILKQLGGLEIAGLVGVIIGCAIHRHPVVLDGFISTTAAVVAMHMAPMSKYYMIPSHLSQEPGHRSALEYLKLDPVLQMNMRLGEGTGAVLCFPLIDSALAVMREMATFDEAGISGALTDELKG